MIYFPFQDMSSLMHTIYDVVDASVNHSCHNKSKTLRVKLTVTPENRAHRRDTGTGEKQTKGLLFYTLTPHTHCTRPSTDLIDFTWDAPEMHCGSVRQVGSVSCVQKLRKVQLFQGATVATDPSPNQIALCKYIPCDTTWTLPNENHLCGTTRESTWICQKYQSASGRFKNLKTTPPCVGHAHSLPSTDVYSGYAALSMHPGAWPVGIEYGLGWMTTLLQVCSFWYLIPFRA